MCFGPVLDSDRTDTCRVTGESESGSWCGVKAFSDQGRSGPDVKIRYTPLSSTPQVESFSERRRVTLAAEVVQVGVTESLNELFST